MLMITKPPIKDSTELIKALGAEAYNAILNLEHIRHYITTNKKPKTQSVFEVIRIFIGSLSTQDPHKIHYNIVRAALEKINGKLLDNHKAVAMLAHELNDYCGKIKRRLVEPKELQAILAAASKRETSRPDNLEFNRIEHLNFLDSLASLEKPFEKANMFLWDKIFLDIISNTGPEGDKAAKQIEKSFKNRLKEYKELGKSPLSFWVATQGEESVENFCISPALQILIKVIFCDKVKHFLEFEKKNVPALTTNVQDVVAKMLSPVNKFEETDQHVRIFHQDSLIGNIPIAVVPQKVISSVFNGIQKLKTVTGHRLTRYLVHTAFDQMVSGNRDYRVVKLDRGASDLAEKLGIGGNKIITDVKEIIHAMAYFEFQDLGVSGNLIQLSKYKSVVTHRQEAYLITIGTLLLPYQTFEAYKNGECGLLIPLLKDPPLVNPNQFHAAQYLLQMEVLSEFSKQSIQLAQEGVIKITGQRWEELALQCGLTKEVLLKVKDRWVQDGTDGAKFLESIEDGYYTLGSDHEKALLFLKEQGFLRIKQSNRGIISASKKSQFKKR